jgi:hypothetical protein
MSGLLNSTGAVSGILGTTVGTPAHTETNAADIGAGVLPVGVTGGSGLTALGTVTAGNISNAAIVHAVGHFHSYTFNTAGTAAPWGGSSAIATPEGTILTATIPDDHTAYAEATGGETRSDYPCNTSIAYEIDGSSPDSSSSYWKGQKPPNSQFGSVRGGYTNTSGSDITLKIQITAYGAGNWVAGVDNPVYMSILIIKTA